MTKALQRIMTTVVDKGEAQKLCEETPLVILMIGIHGGGHQTETKNKSGQKVFHGSVHVSVTVKKESAEADREC